MIRSNGRQILLALTATCFLGMQVPAGAAVIPVDEYLAAADRAGNLARIEAGINRADVSSRLEALGVDRADALARAASLSDQELAKVAEEMDNLPAGGDGLLAVIGIVFVVLLILEITGVTNIFSRI